nr:MFS transporter [Alteromonas flava]
MNAVEIRTALSLAAVYMSRMLGLFMVMPVLAIAATEFAGFSPLLLGLAIGGYGLTQAVLQIPMGMLSDRIGRKPVIIAGLSVFAAGSVLAALADTMWLLILGRILQGAGAIAGAVMALAADTTRVEQRTKVMAIIGVSIGMSFYIAILLGPLLQPIAGLSGLFGLTAVFALVSIFLVIFAVPNAQQEQPTSEVLPQKQELKELLRQPELFKLNLSVALLHMMITILFVNLPVQLSQVGLDLSAQWQFYAPVFALSLVLLGAYMQVAKRIKTSVAIQIPIICLLVAFWGFGYVSLTYTSVVIFTLMFFVGFNFLEARFPALVSMFAPAGSRGSAMGIYASFQFFGAFAGGMLSGTLISWFGLETLYAVLIVMCTLWLSLFLRFVGHTQLKRVTLALDPSHTDAGAITQALKQLTGVIEVNPVLHEGVVYLKVDPMFDQQQAKQALANDKN